MEQKKGRQPMTEEEWVHLVTNLATPIDFDALIRQGVLEKRGSWYKILKMGGLPEHAKARIKAVKTLRNKQVLVTFRQSTKQAEKLLRRYEARKQRPPTPRGKSLTRSA